jgi:hypothetical protein
MLCPWLRTLAANHAARNQRARRLPQTDAIIRPGVGIAAHQALKVAGIDRIWLTVFLADARAVTQPSGLVTMGIFSRLFGSSKSAPIPGKNERRTAARSPVVTVTTRHEDEVDQPWRTGVRFVSELSIAGIPAGSFTVEMSAGPAGFLGLSGESHYQDALRAAKQSKAELEPTFEATLVAEPSNEFGPNAVAVIIAPFGKVGYVPKAAAERFQKIVSAATQPVHCQAKLRGGTSEKPLIGVVLDTTRSTGARLSMYAVDNKRQLDEYWTIRRASDELSAAAKACEHADLDRAVEQYRQALAKSIEAEMFSTSRSIFPGNEPDDRHVNVLDRLTLCLIRRGRVAEASDEVASYFARFPTVKATKVGLAIVKRVEKATVRVSKIKT